MSGAVQIPEGWEPEVVISTGSTFENVANLSARMLKALRDRYEGTNRGRASITFWAI